MPARARALPLAMFSAGSRSGRPGIWRRVAPAGGGLAFKVVMLCRSPLIASVPGPTLLAVCIKDSENFEREFSRPIVAANRRQRGTLNHRSDLSLNPVH